MIESANRQTTSKALTSNLVDPGGTSHRDNPTQKERFENWFVGPLMKFDGDDSIVCLMILMPLIEKILRFDLKISTDQPLTLSDNSPAVKKLAALLRIPVDEAQSFWDCFRNGLMHRAMIKGGISYILDPDKTVKRAAASESGCVRVYIWVLRDLVVDSLHSRGTKMWKDGTHLLPDVF